MKDTESQHPLEQIAELLANFGDYPDSVTPVPACMTGVAFFPGGAGLWGAQLGQPMPPMPIDKVMVVGHNFDSEDHYKQSLARGCERVTQGAWGGLCRMLRAWDIPLEDCFFTNAYMGLKVNVNPSTGKNESSGRFPGADNHSFVYRCRAFLLKQIQMQEPRLMLTLGKEVLPVVAPIAHELTSTWSGATDLQELDRRNAALIRSAQFPGVRHLTTVVALTHPANRGPNVKRRRYHDLEGVVAEDALVRDSLEACGLLH